MRRAKPIGSDFELSPSLFFSRRRSDLPKGAVMLASGRDCMEYIIEAFTIGKGDTVLLPSYLCPSIIAPWKEHGINPAFYKVKEDLSIDLADMEKRLRGSKRAIILVIHYFGFIQPDIKKIAALAKRHKAILVEDLVQSMLTPYTPLGDCSFTSYRKWLPLPDGSALTIKGHTPYHHSLRHIRFFSLRLLAGLLRWAGMRKTARRIFILTEERAIDSYRKPAPMASISRFLLRRIDMEEVRRRRQKNFDYLLANLKNRKITPFFKRRPKDVCPLGFPIMAKDRDRLKDYLISERIYPPVHWDLPKDIKRSEFPASWKLSESMLTIPIDQSYGLDDMKRVVECLNRWS